MQKEIINEEIGGDGGKIVFGIDQGAFKAEVSYPIGKLIQPAKDALKNLIPGEKYDGYVDTVVDKVLEFLGLEVPAPAAPVAPPKED